MSPTSWPNRISHLGLPSLAVFSLISCLTLVAGCSPSTEVASEPTEVETPAPPVADEPSAEMVVRDARLTVLPNGGAAVYLEVENRGSDDRLTGIETEFGNVELHETLEEDGVMRMRPRPDGFAFAAGATLALEPAGKHGMLMHLEVEEGRESLPLSLIFEHAGSKLVEASLLGPGGDDHSHH